MDSIEDSRIESVEHFLDLIKSSRKGKFKIYVGMAAGVGKTFRMLQEAHQLIRSGIDVCIGYIETHGRAETEKLTEGLPGVQRRSIFYKGKILEEMDVDAILIRKPELVLVDELAHTNIPGSRNAKRWEDVLQILEGGINVISTVNIQHIESINREVERITGVEIKERVPDSVIELANEIVNIDLTIDELLERLKEGKIYDMGKVPTALNNFFQTEKLLQLRELALREVTKQVGRKIKRDFVVLPRRNNAVLTCLSSNSSSGANLIRKSARLASIYNSKWYVLYVQTPKESPENINGSEQRHLINNFKLAAELDAEVVKINGSNVAETIVEFARKKDVGTIVLGKPNIGFFQHLTGNNVFKDLIKLTRNLTIDILIISNHE
ncbi:MAG TPA: sensor histidine kinase KdpD [Ignavibacteriales bacterium]|nr:sensor histidine kinase KdpD [Ignavibacteriales bacterium]